MRVVGLVSAVVFGLVMSGCTKGSSADTAALEHAKTVYYKDMDKSIDGLFGKKPSVSKDKFRNYIIETSSFKIDSTTKKSATESEVAITVDRISDDAIGGIVMMAMFGVGVTKKKGQEPEFDVPALIATIEEKSGKKTEHDQKQVRFLGTLENDQWKFKEMPKERATAWVGKKKK